MNTKILSLFLLTTILSTAFILAGTANPSLLKFTESDQTISVLLSSLNIGKVYDITVPTVFTPNSNIPISLSVSGTEVAGNILTTSGTTSTINVHAVTNYNDLDFGVYAGDITIKEQAPGIDSVTIPAEFIRSFCKAGEQGTILQITDVKIDNNDGDDDEWSPLDEIEVEVEVSNEGNDKIKDVFVELGLFDSEGKNIIKDMEDLDDDEIDLGSIKDDDEDTAIFTFTVPADFEDDNYKLAIKTYSDDNDFGEDILCNSRSSDLSDDFFERINGEREEDEEKHIVLHNIRVSPNPAQCGERVQVTGEVINIGDEDYEDQVKVSLTSVDLGLNLEEIIREDFDQGDEELIEFEFDIPEGSAEKVYDLEFRTHYDYDEDDDTYDEVSEDRFLSTIRVGGNCQVVNANALITAQLDPETPEVVPGKQVILNAKLRNTGDVETTYTISVSGNSAWSNLISIDPQVLTLGPGESRDVNIILSVNDNAQGENELTIRAAFGNEVAEQRVVLTVSGDGVMTGGDAQLGPFVKHIRDNWFIYLIILVNIILIIAIILVIRSMVSPRPL